MKNSAKSIQLPLSPTIYQTYTFQGGVSAMLSENPSILNWYLNEIFLLRCNKLFLDGRFSSPEVLIDRTWKYCCPYFEYEIVPTTHLKGALHSVIRSMLDAGYYVFIDNLDDYYVPGKSWFKEWHFAHDGMIFGYDREKKTYDFLSYDKDWLFQPYKTGQRGVEKGFQACADVKQPGVLSAMKPLSVHVELNPRKILKVMKRYLSSTMENDPPNVGDTAFGIVVHDYLMLYLDLLYNDFYPHERMDRRCFRMIWEHKVVMLQRLRAVEEKLQWDHEISSDYALLIHTADSIRMMYASHFVKPRKSILPILKKKLSNLKTEEERVLRKFTEKLERAIERGEDHF